MMMRELAGGQLGEGRKAGVFLGFGGYFSCSSSLSAEQDY